MVAVAGSSSASNFPDAVPPRSGHDTAKWFYDYWAGTMDQLVRAARHAAAEIAALVPFPDNFDPEADNRSPAQREQVAAWEAATEARKISIIVSEKDGFTARPKDLDALAALGEASLDNIEDILIFIGGTWQRPRALIKCGSSYVHALILEVEGFDRTWTAGVRHGMDAILRPKRRLRAPLIGDYVNAVIVGVVSFWVFFFGLDQLFVAIHAGTKLTRILISLGVAALVVALIAITAAASNQFELLAPGENPKYQRWRARLLSAVGAVVLGVVASAVWAVLSGS